MTRQEFEEKFNKSFGAALRSIDQDQIIKHAFDMHSHDDKISLPDISKSIITASTAITERTMKSVLLDLLPLDE